MPSPRQLHLGDVAVESPAPRRAARAPLLCRCARTRARSGLLHCASGRRAAHRRPPRTPRAASSPPRPRSRPSSRRGRTGARERPRGKPPRSPARSRSGSSSAWLPSSSPGAAWLRAPHRTRSRPCGRARPCPDAPRRKRGAPARRSPSTPESRGYPCARRGWVTKRRTRPRATRDLLSAPVSPERIARPWGAPGCIRGSSRRRPRAARNGAGRTGKRRTLPIPRRADAAHRSAPRRSSAPPNLPRPEATRAARVVTRHPRRRPPLAGPQSRQRRPRFSPHDPTSTSSGTTSAPAATRRGSCGQQARQRGRHARAYPRRLLTLLPRAHAPPARPGASGHPSRRSPFRESVYSLLNKISAASSSRSIV